MWSYAAYLLLLIVYGTTRHSTISTSTSDRILNEPLILGIVMALSWYGKYSIPIRISRGSIPGPSTCNI